MELSKAISEYGLTMKEAADSLVALAHAERESWARGGYWTALHSDDPKKYDNTEVARGRFKFNERTEE